MHKTLITISGKRQQQQRGLPVASTKGARSRPVLVRPLAKQLIPIIAKPIRCQPPIVPYRWDPGCIKRLIAPRHDDQIDGRRDRRLISTKGASIAGTRHTRFACEPPLSPFAPLESWRLALGAGKGFTPTLFWAAIAPPEAIDRLADHWHG